MTGSTDPPRHRRSPQGRYRSLSNFYAADSRRMRSRELDIGLWWLDEAGGPLHRAAWVRDTGELYLTRLGPSEDGGGEVEVLAIVAEQEQLQSALEGWREQCGDPHSLLWLRERVRGLNTPSSPWRAQRLAHQIVRADRRDLEGLALDGKARAFIEGPRSHASVAPKPRASMISDMLFAPRQ
jgi:hypothetical protein